MKNGLYSGLDAEFYDGLLEGELNDYPFWKRLVRESSGPCLEVGCGTGRILIPLLREGLPVDGVDRSKKMVGLLLEKVKTLKASVNASIQSMEGMSLGKKYSLIFIPGFSLQMVQNRSTLEKALVQMGRHMEPDGLLAISLFFPWEELADDGRGEWRLRKKINREDGLRLECHQSTEMDAQAQELVIKNRYSLLSVSREILKEEHNDVKLLWFYPHEFHLLLEESGFEMEATYADFEFEPMDEPVAYAVFLARKSSA